MNNLLEHLAPWIALVILFALAQFSDIKPVRGEEPETDPAITKLGDSCYKARMYAVRDIFEHVECGE